MWAKVVVKRVNSGIPLLNIYEFDENSVKLKDQYVFKTEAALQRLKFLEAAEL
jgi:hypothetical protein